MSTVRQLPVPCCELGECPTWNLEDDRIVWLDIVGKKMRSCAIDGSGHRERSLPETPGSFVFCDTGGLVMAYRRRLARIDADGTEHAIAAAGGFDMNRERFNDGACDSRGRFWVGTMDRRLQEPVGCLYRLDPDLTLHRMADGFILSNGLAWSPDNRLLYHCDTLADSVFVYDFDEEGGSISRKCVFYRFSDHEGRPDGCTVDDNGFLWVAAPGAGAVCRFAPNGRLHERFAVPSLNPSSLAFGGRDLTTLFITSFAPQNDEPRQENDGGIFSFDGGVTGLPSPRFVDAHVS